MNLENKKNFITNVSYYGLLCILVYVFFAYAFPFVSPFVFAFIISYALRKPINFISNKIKLPNKFISIVVVLIFYGTIGVFVGLLGVKLFSLSASFIEKLPEIYVNTIKPFLDNFFDAVGNGFYSLDSELMYALDNIFNNFVNSLGALISDLSVSAVSVVSSKATSLPLFFVKTLLMIISTFFISVDYEHISSFMAKQISNKWYVILIEIKKHTIETLFVYFKSYGKIISITFAELFIGLTILGVDGSFKISLLIALLDILPVLGTGGVIIPWAIVMAVQGNYIMSFGLLAIYILVTVIRNIIEPKIVGKQIGLSPILALLSMFVGAQVFGILGLIGAPIFMSLIIHLNKTGVLKVYK